MKKRIISAVLALALCLGIAIVPAAAKDDSAATVYVTVSYAGELKLSHKAVTVTDVNGSGGLDIDDALYAAHEQNYDGGAAAGYGSAYGSYGLSMTKLWGNDSMNFGYYVNNASAWSLADSVKDGDNIVAFIYTDTTYYSDAYTYFNRDAVSVSVGKSLTLTLTMTGYDTNWNTVAIPAEGFKVTGGEAAAVADKDGKVTLKFSKAGTYVLSAASDSYTIVPPVCVVTVTEASDGEALPFTDVYESDSCYAAVANLYKAGVINGTAADTFSPDETVTRGMAVTVLGRLAGADSSAKSPFTDVKAGAYYSAYVAWAAENGIALGYGNNKFGPEDALRADQLQLLLQRYAKLKGIDFTPDSTAGTGTVTRAQLIEAVAELV